MTALEQPILILRIARWVADSPEYERPGHGWRPGVGDDELYDCNRKWWRVGPAQRRRLRYALMVRTLPEPGLVIGAWSIDPDGWRSKGQPLFDPPKWAWTGHVLGPGDDIYDRFVGNRIVIPSGWRHERLYWPRPELALAR